MIQKPLVSCVMIFYNAKNENFFEEAIESILSQTYSNWELLLADDGSIDESSVIALSYVRQYPDKVRYVKHDFGRNLGMSATRNLGIRHAKGEYIAFLDADDIWLPRKLEEQVSILECHPEAAMLYGRTQYWFSWMENNPCYWTLHPDDSDGDFLTITSHVFDTLVQPPSQLLLFLENKEIYPTTCSMLIRRNVFEDIGLFEEGFRDAHEDMVLHSKIFLSAPVYVSSQCWDRYRMHQNSFWRTADREGLGDEVRRLGHVKYLNWLEQFMQEQQITDHLIWKAFNSAVRPYRHPILHKALLGLRYPRRSLKRMWSKIW